MNKYKVVMEIEVESKSPLDASKMVQEYMNEGINQWQFFVQENDENIFSINLEQPDNFAVESVKIYNPLIACRNENNKQD